MFGKEYDASKPACRLLSRRMRSCCANNSAVVISPHGYPSGSGGGSIVFTRCGKHAQIEGLNAGDVEREDECNQPAHERADNDDGEITADPFRSSRARRGAGGTPRASGGGVELDGPAG